MGWTWQVPLEMQLLTPGLLGPLNPGHRVVLGPALPKEALECLSQLAPSLILRPETTASGFGESWGGGRWGKRGGGREMEGVLARELPVSPTSA